MSDEKKTGIVTFPFRLAFPEVFAPKASAEGGKEKYNINMMFPKDGSRLISSVNAAAVLYPASRIDIMGIRKMLLGAVKDKWGEDKTKWPGIFKSMDFKTYVSPTGKDGWPIRDGDDVTWDGFAGNFFIRASSQFKPVVVNAKVLPIMDPSEVFGGLICCAQINAFAYDNSGNKGVSVGFANLQILKDDGTAFGGGQDASNVYDAWEDSDNPGTTAAAGADEDWG
jgi:hypothetical protein